MDKKEALKQIRAGNFFSLADADKKLRADKEVVLAAVKEYGSGLEYADEKLKADKEVVLEAIKNFGGALEYADDSLKKDREVVLAITEVHGPDSIKYLDKSFKADKEIILKIFKKSEHYFPMDDDPSPIATE